jgi:hypothetical protein
MCTCIVVAILRETLHQTSFPHLMMCIKCEPAPSPKATETCKLVAYTAIN